MQALKEREPKSEREGGEECTKERAKSEGSKAKSLAAYEATTSRISSAKKLRGNALKYLKKKIK